MRKSCLVAALLLLPAGAYAQQPMGMGMQPVQQVKKTEFQVTGGIMIPASGYASRVDDIGWNAGAAFILHPNNYVGIRLEGEYNSAGFEDPITGNATVYGGGIGGGKSFTSRGVTSEGYFVAGLYNAKACVTPLGGGNQQCGSELQFGTKLGFNVAAGHGRVRPVFNIYWLYTWSSPYVSIIPITIGLRF